MHPDRFEPERRNCQGNEHRRRLGLVYGVEMKLMKLAALSLCMACTTSAAYAGSTNVVFTHNGGDFNSTGITSGTLTLTNATLNV